MAGNKCNHIFKQGRKAGKRCNKRCRGELCKDHNKHRQQYERVRIETLSKERREDRNPLLEQINQATCKEELPNLLSIQKKQKYTEDIAKRLIRNAYSYQIATGLTTIEDLATRFHWNGTFSNDRTNVEKKIDSWKQKTTKKGKIVELTEEEVKKKYDKLMRKRDKLREELLLWKNILKAYEKKTEQLKNEREQLVDQLDNLEIIEV